MYKMHANTQSDAYKGDRDWFVEDFRWHEGPNAGA